jgi:hypothetical protein
MLRQYLDFLPTICEEKVMHPKRRRELSRFLRQNATEVTEIWAAVRAEIPQLKRNFWQDVRTYVKEGLNERKQSRWEVVLEGGDEDKLSVYSPGTDDSHLHCLFRIKVYANRFEYGISWSEQLNQEKENHLRTQVEDIQKLRDDLTNFSRHAWWLALKRMEQGLEEESSLRELLSGNGVQKRISDHFFALFDRSSKRVGTINARLKRLKA